MRLFAQIPPSKNRYSINKTGPNLKRRHTGGAERREVFFGRQFLACLCELRGCGSDPKVAAACAGVIFPEKRPQVHYRYSSGHYRSSSRHSAGLGAARLARVVVLTLPVARHCPVHLLEPRWWPQSRNLRRPLLRPMTSNVDESQSRLEGPRRVKMTCPPPYQLAARSKAGDSLNDSQRQSPSYFRRAGLSN